jgi:small subunit ribosomal protein S15
MLDVKKKADIIKKFQTHKGDTGSSEVQIAILSTEIEELIEHLKTHRQDGDARSRRRHDPANTVRLPKYSHTVL